MFVNARLPYTINQSSVIDGLQYRMWIREGCVIRDIIGELIRKLIYEYLLPLVLKAIKNLIICYITKKIKEEQIQYIKSLISLTSEFRLRKVFNPNSLRSLA